MNKFFSKLKSPQIPQPQNKTITALKYKKGSPNPLPSGLQPDAVFGKP